MTSPQYPQQPQYQPQHQGVSQPQPAAQQAYGQQIAHSGYSYGGYTSTTLVPADLGKRIIAAIVDYAIIVGLSVAVWIIWFIVMLVLSRVPGLGALLSLVIWLALVAISFLYKPYFEVTKDGQTIGKRMQGIKVVKDDGTPVDWGAALLRQLLLSLLGIIELIVVLVQSDRRRLGDMVAHTMVVDASAGALRSYAGGTQPSYGYAAQHSGQVGQQQGYGAGYAAQPTAQAAPYAPSPQPQQPQPPTPPAGPPQAPAYPQPAPPQAPAPQPPQPQAPPPAPPQAPPPPPT
jgi:uncharacterized RDD family membrane protein YckC